MASTSRILSLALFLSCASAQAGSWLTGPTAYENAIQAMADANWTEAEQQIEGAAPQEGRVAWVKRLLRERKIGELGAQTSRGWSRNVAIAHTYAYHNLYLFLRAEGIEGARLKEAEIRADKVYRRWLEGRKSPTEDLRWPYVSFLYEVDRSDEVAPYLASTEGWAFGEEGPGFSDVGKMGYGFQMLLAYFHCARGDFPLANHYLKAAYAQQPRATAKWVNQSDDFWMMRNDPEFLANFPEYPVEQR